MFLMCRTPKTSRIFGAISEERGFIGESDEKKFTVRKSHILRQFICKTHCKFFCGESLQKLRFLTLKFHF